MKKIIYILSGLILSCFLLMPGVSSATLDTFGNHIPGTTTADEAGGGSGSGILDFGNQTDVAKGLSKYSLIKTQPITQILDTVANYVVGVLVIMAIFYILWAAYTFITSAGSDEKVSEARKRIMFAAIGIIVALIAKGIVALVLSLTTATGGTQ